MAADTRKETMTALVAIGVPLFLAVLYIRRTITYRCWRLLSRGRWEVARVGHNFDHAQRFTFHENTIVTVRVEEQGKSYEKWFAESGDASVRIPKYVCNSGMARGIARQMTGSVTEDMAKELL